jgi:hypothetical protein
MYTIQVSDILVKIYARKKTEKRVFAGNIITVGSTSFKLISTVQLQTGRPKDPEALYKE